MKRKAFVWIFLFAVIFATPFVTYSFLGKGLDSENYENREIAERPALTRDNYASFPEEYEGYFNDNIPYRNQLVRMNSGLDLFMFKDSSNEKVVIGKDGWLFYTGPGNPVEQSTGRTSLTEEELFNLAGKLLLAKQYVEARGAEFIFFIAPNKESIYTEELPDYYPVVSDYTQAMQFVDYLRQNTDIRVVWPYEELLKAKKESGCYLYSHLDTHWGNTGAYVGARALAGELGVEMPALTELTVEEIPVSSGDLAKMLNLFIPDGDVEYNIKGYEVADGNEGTSFMEFHSEEGDDRTVVIRRDSFGARLSKVLQHVFKDVYATQGKAEGEEEADIFVYETVERHVDDIWIDFDYLVLEAVTENETRTVKITAPYDLEYPYVSIFKKADNTDEWETIQAAEPFQNMTTEVPAGESGQYQIYILGDENGESIVYETTLWY